MAGLLMVMMGVGLAALVYLRRAGLRWQDLPLLALLTSFLFFLSRFNSLVTVKVFDRPLTTIHLYVVGLFLLLLLARLQSPAPLSRQVAGPLRWLGLFGGVSLVSGLVNGGLTGAGWALQVLIIVLGPPLLAWVVIECLPRDAQAVDVLARLMILVLGLVTPAILLVSALRPDLFAAVLGWNSFVDWGEGFLRGWSPLGSTIVTGCLVTVAFGLALHEAVARRSRLHLALCVLAAASILFTASRSVLIVFLVFNGVYWSMIRQWRLFFRYAAPPAVGMAAIVAVSLISGAIHFDRFLESQDYSTAIRYGSVRAAVAQGLESPVLGQGPGRLYHEIRTTWVRNETGRQLGRERLVGGAVSAVEPHNLYAYLFAEHGALATLAFVLAFAGGLPGLWRARGGDDLERRSRRAVFAAAGISLLLMFLTASWPLVNPHFSFFFWVFVFAGLHWSAHAAADRRTP